MAAHPESEPGHRRSRWRLIGWSVVAVLLLIPLVSMQFEGGADWTLSDFIVAGVLLGGTGLLLEFAVGVSGNSAYRAAFGVAVVGGLLLTWINLAVGIIGSEAHPANLLYFGALAVGAGGALVARFQAGGMAWATFATAIGLVLIAVIALGAGWGVEGANWPWVVVVLNGFFAALFAGAGVLFQQAAREQARPDADGTGHEGAA